MKRIILILTTVLTITLTIKAQKSDSIGIQYLNTAEIMLKNDGRLNIGGYGEVHYNQPFSKKKKSLAPLMYIGLLCSLGIIFQRRHNLYLRLNLNMRKNFGLNRHFSSTGLLNL